MLKNKRKFTRSKFRFLIFFPSLCFVNGATVDTVADRLIMRDFSRTYTYQPYTQEGRSILLPITDDDEKNLFLMHPQVKILSFPENIGTNPQLEMPDHASSAETALKRLIMKDGHPIDGRCPVNHPEKDSLYRVHAQLMIHFNDEEYGGSGTLVGPHHLITAAHNLYDRKTKSWASKIKVRFSLDGNYLPFDQQHVVRAYTYKQWVNPSERDSQSFDLALFILDHSIGDEIGWHGLCALHQDSLPLKGEVSIAAYPAEVVDTAFPDHETKRGGEFKKMWRMMNKNHDHTVIPMEISPTRVYYQIDTSGGQSGSGIVWLKEKDQAYVMAVHAYGEGEQDRGNYGTRLTAEKLIDLQKWISETYGVSLIDNTDTTPPQAEHGENDGSAQTQLNYLPTRKVIQKVSGDRNVTIGGDKGRTSCSSKMNVDIEQEVEGNENQTIAGDEND